MNKNPKNPALHLVIGVALGCISVITNSGIANQIALAKSIKPQNCDVFAYVTDKDPQGLNVRNGASINNKILGQIPINETVKIIATTGDWVQITDASDGFPGTGWVFVPKLGISTRGYGTNGVDLYASASPKSRKIGRIPSNVSVKLLGCRGDWARVEYQGVKGWLKKEDRCGAALTTCS